MLTVGNKGKRILFSAGKINKNLKQTIIELKISYVNNERPLYGIKRKRKKPVTQHNPGNKKTIKY